MYISGSLDKQVGVRSVSISMPRRYLNSRFVSTFVGVLIGILVAGPFATVPNILFADEAITATMQPSDTSSTLGTSGVEGGQGGVPENTSTSPDVNSSHEVSPGQTGAPALTGAVPEETLTVANSDGALGIVKTGDASSGLVVKSAANNDTTTTNGTTTDSTSTPSFEPSATSSVETAEIQGGDTTIENDNLLAQSSTAMSSANTGQNGVSDSDGARVFTGSADSFGALISAFNIVVTNSVGNILFLQNPLGDALDLTNSFSNVFGGLLGQDQNGCSFLRCSNPLGTLFNVITDNVAEVTNTLIVRSDTGGNDTLSSEGAALIHTGDSRAFGSLINFGNLQIINSRYLVILLNNVGNLAGDIVLPAPDFFKELSASAHVEGGSSIDNQNTAEVINNATTTADTGNNFASSTDSSLIQTGTGQTKVDIHNIVNSNSVGGHPICFIISVGGHWNGHVVALPTGFSEEETPFGKIICGAGGSSRTTALPENFHATTTNYAKILNNALVEATTGNNSADGVRAAIKTGNAQAFLQILNVVNQNIVGQDWIFALFTVSGDWNGNLTFGSKAFWADLQQKIDEQTNYINKNRVMGGASVTYTPDDDLQIVKTASAQRITTPGSVDYTIRVVNKGGPAYHAVLFDNIRDSSGKIIHQERWKLDTIKAGEEIIVNYTAKFATSTVAGLYTNSAQVKAITRNPSINPFYGTFGHSAVASTTLEISPLAEIPEIPESKIQQCTRFLDSYIGKNQSNDPVQVKRLQSFLREWEGFTSVVGTGQFDQSTYDAVVEYQNRNRSSILDPWGVDKGTGYVYYTTRKQINDAYCKSVQNDLFPLTNEQKTEIEQFKKSYGNGLKNYGVSIDTSVVGMAPLKRPKLPVATLASIVVSKGEPVKLVSVKDSMVASAAVADANSSQSYEQATSSFFKYIVKNLKQVLPQLAK